MDFKIEIMPEYNIVYIRRIGAYGQENIEVMERLKAFSKNKGLLNDESIILGIAQDNPELLQGDSCRYDACLVISNDININNEYVHSGKLSGGKYAIFTINHTEEDIKRAWNEMFSILASKGYSIDNSKTIIERYVGKIVKNHKCEICVPIN